jgi:hypothetical protein
MHKALEVTTGGMHLLADDDAWDFGNRSKRLVPSRDS